MRYRKLGRTNLEVSEIGFGAWGIGGALWTDSQDGESVAALRRAIELGVNFIDTALAYGDGHSETLVGRIVKESGQPVYIATKVPPRNQLWPAQLGIGIEDVFPYDYVMACTERSLRHLNVETIDLQQLHVWSPDWIERDEWRRALEDLKTQGKARFVGISINDHQPDTALDIINSGLIDTVQVIYNIFDQSPGTNLFPLCIEKNIGVLARVPLDEGGLTGTITEDTEFAPGDFRADYFRGGRKKQVVERIAAIRGDLAATPGTMAEIALRYCISDPAVSTVIPGMRKIRNVESSASVSDLGPLAGDIRKELKQHAWIRNFYD
ncbi:MAG: aldo/keto reductase [Acidobacteria bacterium]|nr:aldo/keto reductase [Acidobacteriota bacterium]